MFAQTLASVSAEGREASRYADGLLAMMRKVFNAHRICWQHEFGADIYFYLGQRVRFEVQCSLFVF